MGKRADTLVGGLLLVHSQTHPILGRIPLVRNESLKERVDELVSSHLDAYLLESRSPSTVSSPILAHDTYYTPEMFNE